MAWDHLNIDKAHIAYAVVGVFTTIFSLISLIVKEKLYTGEAVVATIYGAIVGPYALNWFSPTSWGNSDYITLEISRIVLVVQIFAVAVELPKKYMLRHWQSVSVLLVGIMTFGWLVVGAFIYLLFPALNFSAALVIAACTTATDPVLAAAVVGKGKFAQRVPGHLRNLLSAESGSNDGMAFPFVFLGLNLVLHRGHPSEIAKEWICVSVLYECGFGLLLGIIIGFIGRHIIKYCESHDFIDTESFLAFYVVLAIMCAGFGSMLGVDDLLTSFAAGATFAWDGWFAKKTEESHVSSVIDLLLNMSYFIYFGAIIPFKQYNNSDLGTEIWRLILCAVVLIFLRRIPAVFLFKPLIPDIKTWREALFCGHFGPVGVGAIFTAMMAKGELEAEETTQETPLELTPGPGTPHYHLISLLWPIVSFTVIASMIVHGSSAAMITLGRHFKSISITMTFTKTNTRDNSGGSTWLNRLPKLDSAGRTFSLHRVETRANKNKKKNNDKDDDQMERSNTIETSGIKYRPAGGIDKRKRRERRKERKAKATRDDFIERNRPQPKQFYLGDNHGSSAHADASSAEAGAKKETDPRKEHEEGNVYTEGNTAVVEQSDGEVLDVVDIHSDEESPQGSEGSSDEEIVEEVEEKLKEESRTSNSAGLKITSSKEGGRGTKSDKSKKARAYTVGDMIVVENDEGEVIRTYQMHPHSGSGTTGASGSRPRSESLVGRTLNVVGLRKGEGKSPEPRPPTAKQTSTSPSISANGISSSDGTSKDKDDDAEVDSDSDSDEEDEDSDSEFNEETEVEKKRRLAALSKDPQPRDEDDEEN